MQTLLTSLGPLAPLAVFLLATGESAAFLGLIIPGEVAVILGGVVAGAGTVPLWVMAVVAVAGAITGDSIGYLLGGKTGPAMLASHAWRASQDIWARHHNSYRSADGGRSSLRASHRYFAPSYRSLQGPEVCRTAIS